MIEERMGGIYINNVKASRADIVAYVDKLEKENKLLKRSLSDVLPELIDLLDEYCDRYLTDDYSDIVANKIKIAQEALKEVQDEN
jgi:hypothetical protein